jgi:hypothetical protein
VNRQLISEDVAATRRLDGVEIADEVGDGDVGGGEFFDVPLCASDPGDGGIVAGGGNALAPVLGNRREGIVVDFAPFDDGHCVVEEISECAQDARLCLPAEAQENEVMP